MKLSASQIHTASVNDDKDIDLLLDLESVNEVNEDECEILLSAVHAQNPHLISSYCHPEDCQEKRNVPF